MREIFFLMLIIFNALLSSIFVPFGYVFGIIRIGFGAGMELADESAEKAAMKHAYRKRKK